MVAALLIACMTFTPALVRFKSGRFEALAVSPGLAAFRLLAIRLLRQQLAGQCDPAHPGVKGLQRFCS